MTRSVGCTAHSIAVRLLLLALVLGLVACSESTSTMVQCPTQPTSTPSEPETWVQAPGQGAVTLALPTTVFSTDEHVQAVVFNHSKVVIEPNPVYESRICTYFGAERLVSGIWQAFNSCRPMNEAGGGGDGGNVDPGTYKIGQLKIVLSPGTYRLKLTYAIYPHNREIIDGTVYSLPFQVCECAQCVSAYRLS